MKIFYKKAGKFYRNLRLQSKLTFTHLILVILPMIVLSIFFYARLYNMIVADTVSKEQSVSTLTAPLIEDLVNEILDAHLTIKNLPFYRTLTQSDLSNQSSGSLLINQEAEFKEKMDHYKETGVITDVKIYAELPVTFFPSINTADTESLLFPMKSAQGTYWYGIFEGSPSTYSMFCPPFYLSHKEIEQYGNMAYISKASVTYKNESYPCYLAVYFSNEKITELLKNNLSSADNVAYIINGRDNLIATTDNSLSSIYHFDYDQVEDSFMSSNNFITKNILGEEVYAGFYSIRHTDWYMVVAMPSGPLIYKSLSIMAGFCFIYAACIIGAFLIATLLSHSITNRLSLVIDQMAKARSGPPIALPAPETQDEIGNLIDTYNYMSRVINELINHQAQVAEDLRVAEFNSLQAQINPHFLYNTMDMINWLSQQGRSSEVTSAIQKLSRFYKLTLSRKKSLSTIADELEHVSIYAQLQNMRFHNTIDFLVDVPDTLLEYTIPKLTFQPVVENSILHGILEKEDKHGTILLAGWIEEHTIVILISDDGVGIPEDKLKNILSGEEISNHSAGSNIAVYNTHRRLQLLYGSGYGLKYKSTPGAGTEVEIRLPALHEYKGEMPTTSGTAPDKTRFIHALHLLARPDMTIQKIAQECGYENPQQFCQDFEKHYGYSPEEYRTHIV